MKHLIKFTTGIVLIVSLIEVSSLITKGKLFIGDENYLKIIIAIIIFAIVFAGIKNWNRYWIRGGIIGALVSLVIFAFIWSFAASETLPKLQADYKESTSCKQCEKEGASSFDCAVRVCSDRASSNCKESFEQNFSTVIEKNNITDQDEIGKIRKRQEQDFIYRQCNYKVVYENGTIIDTKEPVHKKEPTFLTALFSSASSEWRGFGLVSLFIPLFAFPIIIGIIVGIVRREKE